MANHLSLNVDDFIKDLQAEPASLASESAPLVTLAAEAAADEIRDAYPRGPGKPGKGYTGGNLKAGVGVRKTRTNPAVSSNVLISAAPHAHLYEDGTHVARAHPTFWPIAHKHQARLKDELVSMVESRDGYKVTGS